MTDEKKAAKAAPLPTVHVSDDHPMRGLVDAIATPPRGGDLVELLVTKTHRPPAGAGCRAFGHGAAKGRDLARMESPSLLLDLRT